MCVVLTSFQDKLTTQPNSKNLCRKTGNGQRHSGLQNINNTE